MTQGSPRFYDQLRDLTRADREFLLAAPLIGDAIAGRVSRGRYVAFLTQAWHHVRHTVPLLMSVGGRLPDRHAALREHLLHYLEEEAGHDDWILNDIQAAGGDREAAARSVPNVETEAMVAYAYDMVMRRNPVGFFGMVYVLEGTSAALAVQAADQLGRSLQLPANAFTYLRSHGTLDVEHVQHLAGILDQLTQPEDREAVVACARGIFWLYGQMFRGVDRHLGGHGPQASHSPNPTKDLAWT